MRSARSEDSMSYETIELVTDEPLATIRLNRPARMNAVIEQMYVEIRHALSRVGEDPELRTVILTGSVLRRDGLEKQAFCAGADLKKHASGDRSEADRRRYIELAQQTARDIYEFPSPVVAAVNGPARGAGAELALCCDFILMAEQATLAFPEIGLGTFVGGGVTHVLPQRVGPARAKELIYTGRVVDGPAAVKLGLALSCHPVDCLLDESRKLALELAGQAPLSIAYAKFQLQRSPSLAMTEALRLETEAILTCMESEDWREGLRAFGEKRKPRFSGR
jgi:enoyl-CoA hydratase